MIKLSKIILDNFFPTFNAIITYSKVEFKITNSRKFSHSTLVFSMIIQQIFFYNNHLVHVNI